MFSRAAPSVARRILVTALRDAVAEAVEAEWMVSVQTILPVSDLDSVQRACMSALMLKPVFGDWSSLMMATLSR